jgi:hypothetical protein
MSRGTSVLTQARHNFRPSHPVFTPVSYFQFQSHVCQAFDPATAAETNARFLSADDFDGTGILTGVDPCASSYWWMPELYATEESVAGPLPATIQATQRAGSRPASTSRSTSAANAA